VRRAAFPILAVAIPDDPQGSIRDRHQNGERSRLGGFAFGRDGACYFAMAPRIATNVSAVAMKAL
jgi:hypothetical protein